MDNKIIPVIVQHFETNQVLTLAYMNNEALQRTIKGPDVWFYSRSRKELWHKGETSGNYLKVKSISIDCDNDALLVKVYPTGPSCHTGKESCFSNEDLANIEWKSSDIFSDLSALIEDRKISPKKGSYVNKLLGGGSDYISQKILEEACETIVEINSNKEGSHVRLIEELGDLFFHILVMMSSKSISMNDVESELEKRKKH
ncbi:MAG: bifunctional phosphoribosyl-AMP cyclohydrolase/phosphoribosyl-ATP diphosphatase [Actinobacteria bacterium]|nr:bifunctional phosphoribosyl-AMP cyclohydrolase/phosphoribosyl-ATP diphosphatase [Actinomycetota bacterium]